MQNQPTRTVAEEEDQTDADVLCLLLKDDNQRPWSDDELVKAIGPDTGDSLARLGAAGLIHRLDAFAFASRAALRAQQLTR